MLKLKKLGSILLFLIIIFIPSAFAGPEGWSEDIKITYSFESSHDHSMVADFSGNVHIVWSDWTHGAGEIYWFQTIVMITNKDYILKVLVF